ncbi:TFIIH subunit Tfb4/p34 [Pseudomassariella vexata]|uniref:General transcription and DNA repair factor IIH subunit TFB4 n=1 Tax=Pseudomassariella vexata TaxID=1141098 RepID=A0A1Y2DL42_9PEZI|nr:TFIIH subunit Tfb4/p34 [Pseudomassariella vexata]ORY59973.1 TFIIH subunit Tfb4/p34 [Pseudomassariella vexata]
MNAIDGSSHVEVNATGQTPSLLTIVIDTNPRGWAALKDTLPFSKAIANILVFINAHLAFGNDNQVAVLAAHSNKAVWLYPKSPHSDREPNGSTDGDVEMKDVDDDKDRGNANKYPQFSAIESSILSSLQSLIKSTLPSTLPPTTLIAGALSQSLSHIHKTSLSFAPPKASTDPAAPSTAVTLTPSQPTLHARILIVSVSDSEPSQYIPTMNAVFAASHARIPIDTLSLSQHCSPTFLQQAAVITGGVFLSAALNPRGLLTYLMFGLLADAEARNSVTLPTQDSVDFRAACFCHRKVVDTGFVCSICLSIFCEVPQGAECLTCGTKLALGSYGANPAVVPRKKKKRKKALNGVMDRDASGSAAGTPVPG